ncbi:MAG TPA: SH3 beta-barrel fold-containing protein [Methanosarcina sp.]|nr:SH3 beta-barrel fold-containing protein [Methanosarcina sp.]
MSYEIVYNGTVVGLELDDKRRELAHLLSQFNCEITFTKVNGETRVMPCTLQESVLPPITESKNPKKPNADTLSVWCLDKNEWRSFRVANVTKISVIESV